MHKTVAELWRLPVAEDQPALIVVAAFFALGGLSGFLLASNAADAGADALSTYLDAFLSCAQSGAIVFPAASEILWRLVRWFFAALFFGFTALGVLALPALSAARGFFLAFAISSFARVCGSKGLMTSFLLLGIPGLVTIPAFFLLSTQSFRAACQLASRSSGQGKREPLYRGNYLFRCGVCAVAVCIGFLMERYLSPVLLVGGIGLLF